MREILYKYNQRGVYETEDKTTFDGDKQLKITVLPHEFELKISGEVLRKTSFEGCVAVVSNDGETVFYDMQNQIIATCEKDVKTYSEVRFFWKQDVITLEFGSVVTVDHYPNCDGESDRWGTSWEAERTVKLNLKNKTVETK